MGASDGLQRTDPFISPRDGILRAGVLRSVARGKKEENQEGRRPLGRLLGGAVARGSRGVAWGVLGDNAERHGAVKSLHCCASKNASRREGLPRRKDHRQEGLGRRCQCENIRRSLGKPVRPRDQGDRARFTHNSLGKKSSSSSSSSRWRGPGCQSTHCERCGEWRRVGRHGRFG